MCCLLMPFIHSTISPCFPMSVAARCSHCLMSNSTAGLRGSGNIAIALVEPAATESVGTQFPRSIVEILWPKIDEWPWPGNTMLNGAVDIDMRYLGKSNMQPQHYLQIEMVFISLRTRILFILFHVKKSLRILADRKDERCRRCPSDLVPEMC